MTTKFYDPTDPLPAALTLLGAFVLAGTLGYIAFVPPATNRGIVARARTKEREIQNKIDDAKERKGQIEAVLKRRKSALLPDAIGPDALARITRLAQAQGLRVTGFRPQRTTESAAGVTLYPYTVTAEGSFPAAAKFVRAIESTTQDVAVTSLGTTASDGESSATAATVGIVLFGDTPKRTTARPRTPASPTTAPAAGATNGR